MDVKQAVIAGGIAEILIAHSRSIHPQEGSDNPTGDYNLAEELDPAGGAADVFNCRLPAAVWKPDFDLRIYQDIPVPIGFGAIPGCAIELVVHDGIIQRGAMLDPASPSCVGDHQDLARYGWHGVHPAS